MLETALSWIPEAMRLYQYLSKTKIDVLLSQIPSGLFNDLHVELGFNFGLPPGSGKMSPLYIRASGGLRT